MLEGQHGLIFIALELWLQKAAGRTATSWSDVTRACLVICILQTYYVLAERLGCAWGFGFDLKQSLVHGQICYLMDLGRSFLQRLRRSPTSHAQLYSIDVPHEPPFPDLFFSPAISFLEPLYATRVLAVALSYFHVGGRAPTVL